MSAAARRVAIVLSGGTKKWLASQTLEELDRELDRLLGKRARAAKDVGGLLPAFEERYRRSVASPGHHDARGATKIYVFGFLAILSVFVPFSTSVAELTDPLARLHKIDSQIEDLMDELRRRRSLGLE